MRFLKRLYIPLRFANAAIANRGAKLSAAAIPEKPSPLLTAAICLFTLANLAVFVYRDISILRYGSLFGTTGGESLMVYSIWKNMNGRPVYEWPMAHPFSLSLYNYGFYFFYAVMFRLLDLWDAQILTYGRMLTASFAAIGALAQWLLVKARVEMGRRKYLCLALCFGLWFGSSMTRWWTLSIRPDIPALALVMIGLLLLARLKTDAGALGAAVFFYLAWSFKQSTILIAVACILYMLFSRRRAALFMAAVMSVGILATYWLGAPAYRYSVFVAPRIVPFFSVTHALSMLKQSLMANAFVFIPALALIAQPWAKRLRAFAFKDLLRIATLIAFLGGAVAMGKAGAGDNYLFEAFFAGSALLLIEVFENPARRVVILFLILGSIQPLAQLGANLLRQPGLGMIEIATGESFSQTEKMRERLNFLPRPILTSNEVFSLPWNSSGNSYPSFVIDPVFYAAVAGMSNQNLPRALVDGRECPTLMLKAGDATFRELIDNGYRKIGEEYHQGFHYTLFVSDQR